MEDKEIIYMIQKGGQERERATSFLMKEHLSFVGSFQKKLNLSRDTALDAYIDGIVHTVDRIGSKSFREECKISTFIYQLAYFKCVDKIRSKKTNIDITTTSELELLIDQDYNVIQENKKYEELTKHMAGLGDRKSVV